MKRIYLVIVAGIIGMSVSAQGLMIGGKFGPSVASFSKSGYDAKLSMHIGAFGVYKITDMFSAQVELNYENKGSRTYYGWGYDPGVYHGNISSYYKYAKLRLSYLTLPMLARADFNIGSDRIGVYALAGPYFGFLLGAAFDGSSEIATVEYRFNPNTFAYEEIISGDHKVKDDFKGFDFGFSFGGGATYEFMEGLKGLAELRLNPGFLNVSAGDYSKANNFTFNISVGVLYDLGR